MKKGTISSTESMKCVLCGKKTANYRYYEQAEIGIRVPLCDKEGQRCIEKADSINIEKNVSAALRSIKKEYKSLN